MSDPAVRAYFKLMTDAAALLGAKDAAEARKELEEALQFETTLANVSLISQMRNSREFRSRSKNAPSGKRHEIALND